MITSDESGISVWRVAIDTGGTFTDCLAIDPQGRRHRAKVLSSGALRGRVVEVLDSTTIRVEQAWGGPDDLIAGWRFARPGHGDWRTVVRWNARETLVTLDEPIDRNASGAAFIVRSDEPAPVVAARLVTGTAAGQPLPPMLMRLGTTRGTNALLIRRGGRVALFITAGFADLLHIGTQQRPDLFALHIVKPEPLFEAAIEVFERMDASGDVVRALDEMRLRDDARRARAAGAEVAAVCLINSVHNDAHEHEAARIIREAGFDHVICSADVAAAIRILPRAQTTVVNAYLGPVIADYLGAVRDVVGGRLHVMTSAGGLVAADRYRPVDSLLSGPAGGVAGAAAVARQCGVEKIISFDMGGTSTDVSRYDGDFEYEFEHQVGDARIMAPALAIHTVAAGGGSICRAVDGRLIVGPESAGADPGPACYGLGGPLTLTDVNLLNGRIDPDRFEIPLDHAAAASAFDALCDELRAQTGCDVDTDELLDGLLAIANQRMAQAIEQISLRKGYDPADYALISFGGAGGQHACAMASLLGIGRIIMPADSSILSAAGIADAAIERFSRRQVLRPLDEVQSELSATLRECEAEAMEAVHVEGIEMADVEVRRRLLNLRLLGQDATLTIESPVSDPSPDRVRTSFAGRFRSMYGHAPGARAIEVESVHVIASAERPAQQPAAPAEHKRDAVAHRTCRARFERQWSDVPAFDRAALDAGDAIEGPAIVFDRSSSFIIERGWQALYDDRGALRLNRHDDAAAPAAIATATDHAVRAELFANRFSAIAEEMGRMLERAALSTNVKERLDFSCTLLDADGYLVVNAPHMPVHLGAMGLCVRSVREAIDMRPGDVVVTNHPAHGGSHLPDITVITPVFDDGGALVAYVGNRCHHAELGGTRPGSMPPDATTLAEEGVVIAPRYLVEQGEERFDEMETLLRSGAWGGPSRSVDDNLADLRAAIASNQHGVNAMRQLLEAHDRDEVQKQMRALRQRASRCASAALRDIPDGVYKAEERLDDGAVLRVSIQIEGELAAFDFDGTSPRHPGNLNATPAIVRSAVMYVLRLMVGERLPLNEGLLDVVEIKLSRCMLNPEFDDDPAECPAVVGGNVETSQRLVDTLIKALGLCACSQGTMNNVLFGTDRFGYYETICGGSGAGEGFNGADAVHSHMTNTRITDPEIIEHRYPVRVERFEVRRGSGGNGKYRGGDGAVREFTFLQPMSLSVLTQHRIERPFGLRGGEPGAAGRQRVFRAEGEVIELKSVDGCEVQPGNRFIIETPGGGAWGTP